MAQMNDEGFSKQMRKATRKIHKISDDLVNAKVAFAMSDDFVWAEGLLVFYEIFKFLEENTPVNILPSEFHRSEAFELDLNYYLGIDWKNSYTPRPEVKLYLAHLEKLKSKNSMLLLAYVYHLYMGLLSGGQILQKKRQLVQKFNPFSRTPDFNAPNDTNLNEGQNVTKYEIPIFELKKRMRNRVDEMALEFSETLKSELIDESIKCFELNNSIVATVKGVNAVGARKVIICVFIFFVIIFIIRNVF